VSKLSWKFALVKRGNPTYNFARLQEGKLRDGDTSTRIRKLARLDYTDGARHRNDDDEKSNLQPHHRATRASTGARISGRFDQCESRCNRETQRRERMLRPEAGANVARLAYFRSDERVAYLKA